MTPKIRGLRGVAGHTVSKPTDPPPRGVKIVRFYNRLERYGRSGWRPDGLPPVSDWSEVDHPWDLT